MIYDLYFNFLSIASVYIVSTLANFEVLDIQESTPIGQKVHELPEPSSGYEYILHQYGDLEGLKVFSVTKQGEIILKTSLLYEIGKDNSYTLTVVLRRKGTSYGGKPYTRKFQVLDTNNHSPTFAKEKYIGSIREGLPAGSVVSGLEDCFATDKDTSGIQSYEITEGNSKDQFVLDTKDVNGIKLLIVKTTGTIDRDDIRATPYLDLAVEVKDGGIDDAKFAQTVIRINILDINDNPPVFIYPNWQESIQENMFVMQSVMKISATDNDEGQNAELYYYFDDVNDDFYINPSTGEINVASYLDASVKDSYKLKVKAKDKAISGSRVSETNVQIQLLNVANYPPPAISDERDSPPDFKQNQFSVTIRGDLPVKSFVFCSPATDVDPYHSNKKLKYSITGSNTDQFYISEKSGVVTLNKPLNPAVKTAFSLQLSAKDEKGRKASMAVTVNVQPVNLNIYKPIFTPSTVSISIREDTNINTEINYIIRATDNDRGEDGKVSYRIIGGSGIGRFSLNRNSEKLTTKVVFKSPGTFYLKIQAEDNGVYKKYGHLFVIINVTPSFDRAPLLSRPMYVAVVPENEPQDTFVGVIFGKTYYANQQLVYEAGNNAGAFGIAINQETGVVTTTRELDFEEEISYDIEIIVKIIGLTKSTKTLLTILVKNENDNPPFFLQSSVKTYVAENSGDIPSLVCLLATDDDGTQDQSGIKYSIEKGNLGNVFSINSVTGQLSVRNLDYESHKGYDLTIVVNDGKYQAKATVNVVVVDTNDPPHFEKPLYIVKVLENSPENTKVEEIDVVSDTSGSHDCHWGYRTKPSIIELFNLTTSQKSCIVNVKGTKKLAWRKETPKYMIPLLISSKKNPNEQSAATLEVIIEDINDHAPEFQQLSYAVSLLENEKLGKAIAHVSATDLDDNRNGRVSYSLVESLDSKFFTIEANGDVVLRSSLEKNKQYVVTIIAKDQGQPKPLQATTKLYISVLDKDAVLPKFPAAFTKKDVSENLALGAIEKIAATGANLGYEIVGGNHDNCFTISNNGQMSLSKKLDYEKNKQYHLIIRATETNYPPRYSETIYIASVQDENDNPPVFPVEDISKHKEIYIDQYSPEQTVVLKMRAFDKDSGDNGRLTYTISGSSKFKADDEGVITTTTEISDGIGSTFEFTLRATDNGRERKSAEIKIKATVQQGTRPPVFTRSLYEADLLDNVAVGKEVLEITTSNTDSGSAVTYNVASGNINDSFCIDATKRLFVQRHIDIDSYHIDVYKLSIEMTYGYQTTKTDVEIKAKDENDNSPVFTKGIGPIMVKVSEKERVNHVVYTAHATDRDSGENGKVSYSLYQVIAKATTAEPFKIDRMTGELSIDNPIDYEKVDSYRVIIKAQDGSPTNPRYTLQEINIEVIDENDEVPTFSESKYTSYIDMGAKPGEQVMTVFASDFDSGKYGEVSYKIVGNTYDETFSIGVTSGIITLRKPVALRNENKFTLKLQARDTSKVSQVIVELYPITKEGPPKFAMNKFYFSVRENNNPVVEIGRAKGISLDVLKYTIVRDDSNIFIIDSTTGNIFSKESLDAERTNKSSLDAGMSNQYIIYVRAVDLSERFAEASVEINVMNTNDNKPVFLGAINGLIEAVISRNAVKGTEVVDVMGFDADIGDEVSYTINLVAAREYFEIDAKGVVKTRKSVNDLGLDDNKYQFTIVGKDLSGEQSSVQLRVILVNFKQGTIERFVPESQNPIDGPFIKFEESIGNRYPSGSFKIVYPSKHPFTIDEKTGYIGLKQSLDYEKIQKYHIVVEERNEDRKEEYINYDVNIVVRDVNDNSPRFTMKSVYGKVNKNAQPGTRVLILEAEDPDSDDAGNIDFEIKTENVPFSIDPLTNEIQTSSFNLQKDWYNITVQAYDRGIPSRTSDLLSIYIETGDNPPEFEKPIYQFEISENSQLNKMVGQVSAYSLSGISIQYSIEGGDQENIFFIDTQGRILLQGNLDFESGRSSYSLTVQAAEISAQSLTSTCNVIIRVQNENDNDPEFTYDEYRSPDIMENVEIGTTLVQVSATDCDCSETCECAGGLLSYSIDKYRDIFEIDHVSGEIRNIRPLDYDTTTEYRFQVKVQDTSDKPKYGYANVVITLANVNDNAPVFEPDFSVISKAENILPDTIVITVQAKDADGDSIVYAIESGDKVNFVINQKTGVIRVAQNAKFTNDQYILNISASDGTNKGYCGVKINIDDVNDNSPVFKYCQTYRPVIKEQEARGTDVIKIIATDSDRGRNGEVEYEIQEPQKTGFQVFSENDFNIDNSTGLITTNKVFDREIKSSYIVLVVALDGGHGRSPEERNSGSCQIEIQIEDINDHSPVFSVQSYDISVAENTALNAVVLEVSAQDIDEGSNAEVVYSIVEALLTPQFKIDPVTGAISVSESLLNKNKDRYSFNVKASDKGAKQRHSEIEVIINVRPSNPPKFRLSSYTKNIREDTKVGTTILTIEATSQAKDDADKKIYYSIIPGNLPSTNKPQTFSVDASTGAIKVGRLLDYETLNQYILTVSAVDKTGLISNVKVFINLEDVNDNAPVFVLSRYELGKVAEGRDPGAIIENVNATDADSGKNGEVRYSLEESKESKMFSIDPITGQIRTRHKFDRELISKVTFNVKAQDQAVDRQSRLDSVVYVTIQISDINDNPPKFDKSRYEKVIDENAKVGSDVIEIEAADKDAGENAKLNYYIVEGNEKGYFGTRSVHRTNGGSFGFIKVEKILDREDQHEFFLNITASDSLYNSFTEVHITVRDVNDNDPEFERSVYNATIPEDIGDGVFIEQVKAIDKDTASVQQSIKYKLAQEATGYFTIDEDTGKISTGSRGFDRESKSMFTFLVFASDGTRTGSSSVKVKITDVNDEKPRFLDGPYFRSVQENQKKGASVGYVTANDKDIGTNAMITYSLTRNAGEKFTIEENTGLIRTNAVLDRESNENVFKIIVAATDHGKNALKGSVEVTINVTDYNDQHPYFEKEKLETTMKECAPIGSKVAQVKARDLDLALNAELIYSITNGNTPRRFRIDPDTGEITVAHRLDFEKEKRYRLFLSVRDKGLPQLIAERNASMVVIMTDCNDNPPIFDKPSYAIDVREDTSIGTEILKVTANDNDDGEFGEFVFGIVDPDENYQFIIKTEKKTGLVILDWKLDREKQSQHVLKLVAVDKGGKKGYAQLTVNVIDVNDNGPVFKIPDFCGLVEEGVTKIQTVGMIVVSDPDSSTPRNNRCPCTFKIVEDPFNLFTLTSVTNGNTVTIKTKSDSPFDREIPGQQIYKIKLSATDSGSPPQTSVTNVYIELKDKNDNVPRSGGETNILVNAYKGQFSGGNIGKVYIIDNDLGSDDVYSHTIMKNPTDTKKYFRIDNKGMISAKPQIKQGIYRFEVQSTERNRVVKSKVEVNVRGISESLVNSSLPIRMTGLRKALTCKELPYPELESVIADILHVDVNQVTIFSVMEVPESTLHRGVDIWFAVSDRREPGHELIYMRPIDMVVILNQYKHIIERRTGGKLISIGIDACAKETCTVGFCYNDIQTLPSHTIVTSNNGVVPPKASSKTFVSIDLIVKATCTAQPRVPKGCWPINPCKNNGRCFLSQPTGYRCQCDKANDGPRCQKTTRYISYDGYFWLTPINYFFEGLLSFEFRTMNRDGLLLFHGPLSKLSGTDIFDFLAIDLIDGKLRISISQGEEKVFQKILSKSDSLNDGVFHLVEFRKRGKFIQLTLDRCEKVASLENKGISIEEAHEHCEISGIVPGKWRFINGIYPLQFGQWWLQSSNHTSFDIYPPNLKIKPFVGCIRNIIDNGNMYDLNKPLAQSNSGLGCPDLEIDCPPCYHGYCDTSKNEFKCVCDFGWRGDQCSTRATAWRYLANSFSRYTLMSVNGLPKTLSQSDRLVTHYRLQIRTSHDSVILHEEGTNKNGKLEFSTLEIKNSILTYRYNLGGENQTISIIGVNVTDNRWHNITVDRKESRVTVEIMKGGLIVGSATQNLGANQLLDTIGVIDIGGRVKVVDGKYIVDDNYQGCIANLYYNGIYLEEGSSNLVDKIKQNVDEYCSCLPAAQVLCLNGGVCLAGAVPGCVCQTGFRGPNCAEAQDDPKNIYGAPPPPGMLIVLVLLATVLITGISLCALLLSKVKKKKNNDSQLPLIMDLDGKQNIMPYCDEGAGEDDFHNYDLEKLLQHAGTGFSLAHENEAYNNHIDGGEKERLIHSDAVFHTKASIETNQYQKSNAMSSELANHLDSSNLTADNVKNRDTYISRATTVTYRNRQDADDVDVAGFISERLDEADNDESSLPRDTLLHYGYEGEGSDVDDLSELGDSDDANSDDEDDFSYILNFGPKFDQLKMILVPDYDDEMSEDEV